MRYFLSLTVSLLVFLQVSTALAQEIRDGEFKRKVVIKALDLVEEQNDYTSRFDLQNILNFRYLEGGEVLGSDNSLTLREFTCQSSPGNHFACHIEIVYCVMRNEYPPSLTRISISGTTELSHLQILRTSEELPFEVCTNP